MTAAFSFLPTPTATPAAAHGHRFRLKPLRTSSVSTPPFLLKPKKRKNHLRPKILKTLTKPFPISPLPQIAPTEPLIPIPISPPPSEDADFDALPGEVHEVEEFRASAESVNTPGEHSGRVGNISANSVLKFGGYFVVGVFLFETISAVWFQGNTNSREKEGNLIELGNVFVNGDRKLGSELSNVVYYGETELGQRIGEIRAMAREARERERRERNAGNQESDIGREVGARLDRLEKRLNSEKEKLPETLMRYMGLFGNVEDGFGDGDGSGSEEDDRTLVFKKKFRFKSPSMNQRSSPKGFSGLKDQSGWSSKKRNDINGDIRKSDIQTVKLNKTTDMKLNSLQNDGNKLEKKKGDLQKETGSGPVQETSEEMSSIQVKGSLNSNDLEILNPQKLREENQETTKIFEMSGPLGTNGSKRLGTRPGAKKFGNKQSDRQTDMWWFKLPYVLVILLRRHSEHGETGFYSLQTASESDVQGSSYTIAFEDRGDANNFCYLLESFFEDLGDFTADVVPLPTNEVKSHSEKVIVVKKGLLKLYAGQPLAEVEMAFQSLLEQDQNT